MAMRSLLGGGSLLAAIARALGAACLALLPSRYWQVFYRLPVRGLALPSAIGTSLAGLIIGGRGFMAYARLAADSAAQAALDGAARQIGNAGARGEPVTTLGPQLLSIASVVAFTLFTPLGLLATYLTLSGLARALSVVTDEAIGDPILTGLDWMVRASRKRSAESLARRRRAREEGPETGDRLFTGEDAGLAGADFVVVSSRRKPDWTRGTIIITSDGWFRLGEPFDARLPYGLRAVYPMTRVETAEVLRRAVSYELPPVQRGPGRLETP